MKSDELFKKLEHDFVFPGMEDTLWAGAMVDFQDLLTEQFKRRSIGLICDFAAQIGAARTAVFPSSQVMSSMLAEGISDALLFLHHPAAWDIRRPEGAFYQMERGLIEKFRSRRISIFALHVPLDNFSEYSTSATLAKTLEIEIEKPFAPYGGGLAGVIGMTKIKTVKDLQKKYSQSVGHETSLYAYGAAEIAGGKVAVGAGGANQVEILKEVVDNGINTFVTGISVSNEYSRLAHQFGRENGINILGGTHYSSEAFACKAMCRYFEGLGLPARFIADEPCMEDM